MELDHEWRYIRPSFSENEEYGPKKGFSERFRRYSREPDALPPYASTKYLS